MGQIPSLDLAACHHRVVGGQDLLQIHSVAGLKESSVQKTYSTCFLEELAWETWVVVLVVDQVCHHYPVRWPTLTTMIVFTASFGPGGFRTTRVRTNGAQRHEPATARSNLLQLLPILLLFLFSVITALPNMFATSPTPDPRFAFSSTSRYNVERQTTGLGIKYHVNGQEFSGHPIAAELARESGTRSPKLAKFEENVERAYTQGLANLCQAELDRKQRRKDDLVGIFGIGTDWDQVRRLEKEKIESCEELRKYGLYR
jgi:DnaJ homolog subfamily B member 12